MANNLLISGPALAGKTELARERRLETLGPAVIADFQSIYAALLGIVRGPDGRFPLRMEADDFALALTEYTRKAIVTGARDREISVILTNGDGSLARRRYLLEFLGPGAGEEIVDPGEDEITRRLISRGRRSQTQCERAVRRWYSRKRGR